MKEKPNEWVAIADLMAGVMAVVMLLLVLSVVQRQYAEIRHKAEMEQGSAAYRKHITEMLQDMKQTFSSQGLEGLVSIDSDAGKITLRDGVFSRGSACITPEAKMAIAQIEAKVADYLARIPGGQIYVEGHTDNLQVSRPVTDFAHYCTVYDDNYTLSAARAREARRLLIGKLGSQVAKRVVVAGFGDSHPLANVASEDARNRRVEVRFVVQQNS
ncbi:OmpA/MotB family protein [Cupriavidus malaysiensis]|uniref:Flagellar motor protein MotB n=1 Tax=Cupriavidus malaysiensis TaxID=367825 RepID=A0ABM6F005_9BURK|nr:OmpA family protein [Cupriavidus malaysiensis]AOZ04702.1 flagellar motor protein MotB [Cupriavidus malaysiensis]